MNKDGEYSVWFRTSRGEGTEIVCLANGRISGGDCIFRYGGFYEFDEHEFTATLTTTRYAEGPTTVFGVDEVEAKITGRFKGATAVCSGTATQAPALRFEARLFPRQPPAGRAGGETSAGDAYSGQTTEIRQSPLSYLDGLRSGPITDRRRQMTAASP